MPKYQLDVEEQAKRAYRNLSDKLKTQVIEAYEDIVNEGLEGIAEPLYRNLQGRWKYKINGWRIILMQTPDRIIVLDIKKRDSDTYSNVD